MSNAYAAGCCIGYNAIKKAARYYKRYGRFPLGTSAKVRDVIRTVLKSMR